MPNRENVDQSRILDTLTDVKNTTDRLAARLRVCITDIESGDKSKFDTLQLLREKLGDNPDALRIVTQSAEADRGGSAQTLMELRNIAAVLSSISPNDMPVIVPAEGYRIEAPPSLVPLASPLIAKEPKVETITEVLEITPETPKPPVNPEWQNYPAGEFVSESKPKQPEDETETGNGEPGIKRPSIEEIRAAVGRNEGGGNEAESNPGLDAIEGALNRFATREKAAGQVTPEAETPPAEEPKKRGKKGKGEAEPENAPEADKVTTPEAETVAQAAGGAEPEVNPEVIENGPATPAHTEVGVTTVTADDDEEAPEVTQQPPLGEEAARASSEAEQAP